MHPWTALHSRGRNITRHGQKKFVSEILTSLNPVLWEFLNSVRPEAIRLLSFQKPPYPKPPACILGYSPS